MALDLAQVARGLPLQPGVYIFKDARGEVLYVGKAARLRDRVRSYFGADSFKGPQLLERAADLEAIVTASEAEALILENTLIKRHRPRFNIRLKDDKTYPYLKIDVREGWPRLYITRRMEEDGSRYFGPFASASSVRMTLDLLNKLFPFRSCTKAITGTDPRPCLDFHIRRCLGPCIGAVSNEDYRHVIDQVILFLEGKQEVIIRDIKRRMWEAAAAFEYERAAFLRDQLGAIEKVAAEQKAVSTRLVDEDVIATARAGNEAWAEVFFIRAGKLVGRDNYLLDGVQGESDGEVLASFTKQFYASAPYVPAYLLTRQPLADGEAIAAWLTERRGARVRLVTPLRGEKRRLLEMVEQNALQGLEALRIKVLAAEDATRQALEELKEQLNLPRLPQRIECYDISNTQGTNSVASMVVFQDGQPRKAHYRRFRVRTVEGANDFASLAEVMQRRFKRLGEHATAAAEQVPSPSMGEGQGGDEARSPRLHPVIPSHGGEESPSSAHPEPIEGPALSAAAAGESRGGVAPLGGGLGGTPGYSSSPSPGPRRGGKGVRSSVLEDRRRQKPDDSFGIVPDLVLIDGGKGQLSACAEALRMMGLHQEVPVASIAKQQEELFVPDMPESILLPRTSPALYLVQRVRDEAHRFAITFHRDLRSRRGMESVMDIVPGIGPKRKRMLLRHFGSVQRIREASLDELAAVPGMTHRLAEKVKEYV